MRIESISSTPEQYTIAISIEKANHSLEDVLDFLQKLSVEGLIDEADMDIEVLNIAEDIKKSMWEKRKHLFSNK